MTIQEMEECRELNRRGVKITGKQVPDNVDDDLIELINKQ